MIAHLPRLALRRLLPLGLACAPLAWPILTFAQAGDTPPAASAAPAPETPTGDLVKLTPFDVKADSDKSYGALNSNSITAFNARLDQLPISADIFTGQFMRDVNADTVEDLVSTYSAGAGMGAAAGDPSGNTAPQAFDRGSAYQGLELRGLGSTVVKQDGFMPPAATAVGINTVFGLDRVEVIFGPQALLYGNGGAGGVINLISKQAKLYQPSDGLLRFQVDQYGNKVGQLDYGFSTGNVAVVFSTINQQLGSYREYIGGELHGYYTQIAAKAGNTVFRLTAKQTLFDRKANASATLTAGSTAVDARNSQNLHYLLATNQVNASASGADGAGVLDNGNLNWHNVDSFGGDLRDEYTKGRFASLSAESSWASWLTTLFTVGYQSSTDRYNAAGINFYSPTASSNPIPGNWTAALNSTTQINQEPARTKAVRFTALITNDLFDGKAHSQSILGADYIGSEAANIAYAYYLADSNFNVIVNPAVAANNGRTIMPTPAWTVNNGPVKFPLWTAGANRITYNGNNYVLMIQDPVNPAAVSPANALGVTPLNGAFYLQSTSDSRGLFGTNDTSWLGGDLNTLAGFRLVGASYELKSQTGPALTGASNNLDFNLGANYKLLSWLRPYFSVSNAYNLPVIVFSPNPTGPYGDPPKVAHSVGEEVGFKIGDPDGKVSGSIALYKVNSQNEQYLLASNLLAIINPAGLNGRLGAPSTYISVNRASQGLEATFTAAPTSDWRMRLSASIIQGTINNSTSYAPVYNDQFYENALGQVTYKDGTVVTVNGNATTAATATAVAATTAGAVPLTVALMSSPTSIYYANPVAISGAISSSSVAATVLKTVDPVHGAILTGAVGQPISGLQINPGFTVPASIPTSVAGDSTVGYPEFAINYTNLYTVPSGLFKGVKLGGTMGLGWKRADYYYYTTTYATGVPRVLFYLPTLVRFDGIIGYERKFRRYTWTTQLNVTNLFNRYQVVILPNSLNGYAGVDDAVFDQQPRLYTLSTTVSF